MDISVLKDVVIIFALSTFVNLIFTKLKVPTIIGYILTGILAGPHLLALINAEHQIELMAEIGVVLLMFTIGLEFSLQHLIRIRNVVFLGGFVQFALTSVFILGVARFYDLDWQTSLFFGFLTALSSTAIVLKILQERSELTSNYGRTVLGILIFQDIMLVPLILFTNLLKGDAVNIGNEILILGAKTLGIIAFVYIGSRWLIPRVLQFVVNRKNQELFLMSILVVCMGVALLTSEMGMSLAFGAFLAGLMISGSDYSHNAFGNLLPFKDTFTSFFFVSIGMLLDLGFIMENLMLVAGTLFLVIAIKTLIAGGTGFVLGHTFRGTVMVGMALAQVGEFSFILAKIGLKSEIITGFYFQLFLAVAVLSMLLSPLMILVAKPLADQMLKYPLPKFLINGLFPLREFPVPRHSNHLVIIGKDVRAIKLANMVKQYNLPYITIAFDPTVVKEKQKKGEQVLYGDAVNEPILRKAYVDKADIVVVSVGEIIAASAIIEKVRLLNPNAHILARVQQVADMETLYRLGADHVVPEKFETAIELFNQILTKRLLPKRSINEILNRIREDNYILFNDKGYTEIAAFFEEMPEFKIHAYKLEQGSEIVNKSLREISLRTKTGVTLLALRRNGNVIDHPRADVVFQTDDLIYLLGKSEQLLKAQELLTPNIDN